MKKYILVSIIAISMAACGPKITKEQAKNLNELTLRIDSSVHMLTIRIDSNRLMELTDAFFEKKHFFENDMKDTVDRETIFIIDKFMRNKKAMNYLSSNYGSFKKEAKTLQLQLKNLKHDVDKRKIDEQQFKKYYDLEYNNFLQLEDAVNTVKDVYLRIDTEFVIQMPKIDSIINAYNSKVDA